MKELLKSKKFKVFLASFILTLMVFVITKRSQDQNEVFDMFKQISSYMNGDMK